MQRFVKKPASKSNTLLHTSLDLISILQCQLGIVEALLGLGSPINIL